MLRRIKNYLISGIYASEAQKMIKSHKVPDPEISLRRLKSLGFSPNIIFDVGAFEGLFSDMCLSIWPESKIYAFEPLQSKLATLKEKFSGKSVEVVSALVGDEYKSAVPFFADETASSILESQPSSTKKVQHQQMITLDDFASQHHVIPNFLKIDVQGFEYNVFKGFEKNLAKVDAILVELNFLPIYKDTRIADEVITYLKTFNFVMYDICEIHRRPLDNALFQIDFLFVKHNSFLRNDSKWSKESN